MRRFFPLAVLASVLLAGCVAPSTTQPSPDPTPSAPAGSTLTTPPGSPPSSVPLSDPPGEDVEPGEDEPGRYSYRCTSLDASPEVQLSSLAEVWAATNYTRMRACEPRYEGSSPFQATPREEQAISTAGGTAGDGDGALSLMLDILRLCTRVSDEAGPDGFAGAAKATLLAAAQYCPEAPQSKIMTGWANGTRVGDGSYVVGEQMQPGGYQLVKQGASSDACTWSVAARDGSVAASGNRAEAGVEVDVAIGQNFTSDKCGIWGKMY